MSKNELGSEHTLQERSNNTANKQRKEGMLKHSQKQIKQHNLKRAKEGRNQKGNWKILRDQ